MSQDGMRNPQLRASAADRERIVEELRRHTADGRLTMDEFEQRMTTAYRARTYGELSDLTRDLPVDLGAQVRVTGAPSMRRGAVGDVATAVAGAALSWGGHDRAARNVLRARRHQQRLARRGVTMWLVTGVAGWLGLSVFLTGIWVLAGLVGSRFGYFWPIWPIGFVGLFLAVRLVRGRGGPRG